MNSRNKTRIMVFGTFDVLHKGHLHFFRQARALAANPFLIVSLARDKNVAKIKNRPPLLKESRRLAAVRGSGYADKAVLGGLRSYLGHIVAEHPAIIALGYDQKAYTKGLRSALKKRGLNVRIVRLLPHRPHVYKSSLVKKRLGML